jgi:hypothetical protein
MKMKEVPLLAAAIIIIIAFAGSYAMQAQQKGAFLEAGAHRGKVISTMNSGGYTYIEFEENGKKLWVACSETKVSVGDTIEFSKAAPMRNFYSRTLKRTFKTILFVNRITVTGSKGAKPRLPEGHGPVDRESGKKITVEPGSVKKAEKGYTVAECYAKKDSLAGKNVTVRGKVVKFTAKIMGRNWVHIRDGSGEEGSNDLTVTTKDTAAVGDLVLVTGKIAYDKDFGAGYVYKVIIEDASVIVE